MNSIIEEIVPISICVVLPIAIVLIRAIASMHADNKRAEILIKAIEANNSIDADRIAQAMQRPRKTDRQTLNTRLQRGCKFSLIGLIFVIYSTIQLISDGKNTQEWALTGMFVGAVIAAIGASHLIVYFVSRNQAEDDK